MKRTRYGKHDIAAEWGRRYLSRRAEVDLELVELEDTSFHLIVPVEIDGVRGDMIVDTGASVTVVERKLFPGKELEGAEVKVQSGSVSGQIEDVRIIRADVFRLGGRKIKDFRLAAMDLEYVNEMYDKHLSRKIIGLLGCDFFVNYRAVIDYSRKKLTLNFGKN